MATDADLANGGLEIIGQLRQASNAALLVRVAGVEAIYKPIVGEQPLWDFPSGTLALRELAAYRLSEALGWGIVPKTIMREGPFGAGMVQQWIDVSMPNDLVEWVQSDLHELRRIALFDALINNTDRKISHLLPTREGRVFGCDHGLTFHVQDKLRTVLWQFRGQEISSEFLRDLNALEEQSLSSALDSLLDQDEIAALWARRDRLCFEGRFPLPSPDWPAMPWPLY